MDGHFHPICFGKRLGFCPSWRDVPDENAVNVMLDPGLAFGTGTSHHGNVPAVAGWPDLAGKTIIDLAAAQAFWPLRH